MPVQLSFELLITVFITFMLCLRPSAKQLHTLFDTIPSKCNTMVFQSIHRYEHPSPQLLQNIFITSEKNGHANTRIKTLSKNVLYLFWLNIITHFCYQWALEFTRKKLLQSILIKNSLASRGEKKANQTTQLCKMEVLKSPSNCS